MSRKKKYSPLQGAIAYSENSLNGLAVWNDVNSHIPNKTIFSLFDYNTCSPIKLTDIRNFCVIDVRHKWHIVLIVVGQDDNNEDVFSYVEVVSESFLLRKELTSFIQNLNTDFIKNECDIPHVTNACWVGIPRNSNSDKSFSPLEVYKWIEYNNGW